MPIKTQRAYVKPACYSFIGEFSKQWVATRSINGEVVHSVRRPTKTMAEYDITVTRPNAPTLL